MGNGPSIQFPLPWREGVGEGSAQKDSFHSRSWPQAKLTGNHEPLLRRVPGPSRRAGGPRTFHPTPGVLPAPALPAGGLSTASAMRQLGDFVFDSQFLPFKLGDQGLVRMRPAFLFEDDVVEVCMLGLERFNMLRNGHSEPSFLTAL